MLPKINIFDMDCHNTTSQPLEVEVPSKIKVIDTHVVGGALPPPRLTAAQWCEPHSICRRGSAASASPPGLALHVHLACLALLR